ncbi:MAG: 2-C-methyl-D-erythritol 4-phosphate cytidylyltransferase, partial [Candidatus Bipolaricaulia bacterium]
MRVTAVVLAAGRGRRMGGDENKTFLQLAGRPLLCHALSAFAESSRIDEIVVVVRPGEEERVRSLLPAGTLPV